MQPWEVSAHTLRSSCGCLPQSARLLRHRTARWQGEHIFNTRHPPPSLSLLGCCPAVPAGSPPESRRRAQRRRSMPGQQVSLPHSQGKPCAARAPVQARRGRCGGVPCGPVPRPRLPPLSGGESGGAPRAAGDFPASAPRSASTRWSEVPRHLSVAAAPPPSAPHGAVLLPCEWLPANWQARRPHRAAAAWRTPIRAGGEGVPGREGLPVAELPCEQPHTAGGGGGVLGRRPSACGGGRSPAGSPAAAPPAWTRRSPQQVSVPRRGLPSLAAALEECGAAERGRRRGAAGGPAATPGADAAAPARCAGQQLSERGGRGGRRRRRARCSRCRCRRGCEPLRAGGGAARHPALGKVQAAPPQVTRGPVAVFRPAASRPPLPVRAPAPRPPARSPSSATSLYLRDWERRATWLCSGSFSSCSWPSEGSGLPLAKGRRCAAGSGCSEGGILFTTTSRAGSLRRPRGAALRRAPSWRSGSRRRCPRTWPRSSTRVTPGSCGVPTAPGGTSWPASPASRVSPRTLPCTGPWTPSPMPPTSSIWFSRAISHGSRTCRKTWSGTAPWSGASWRGTPTSPGQLSLSVRSLSLPPHRFFFRPAGMRVRSSCRTCPLRRTAWPMPQWKQSGSTAWSANGGHTCTGRS